MVTMPSADMYHYDSIEFDSKGWTDRYPSGTRGITRWKKYALDLPKIVPSNFDKVPSYLTPYLDDIDPWDRHLFPKIETASDSIGEFERIKRRPKALKAPRVFISYKRENRDRALRIAYIVNDEGFHYWMDVYEPALTHDSNTDNMSEKDKSVLVAAVIEMGLLNSSHLIACMTTLTKKSRWVPYEFGRAKDRSVLANQTSSWLHPDLSDIAEYQHLCPSHRTEGEIRKWLRKERSQWENSYGPLYVPATTWTEEEPDELPTEKET